MRMSKLPPNTSRRPFDIPLAMSTAPSTSGPAKHGSSAATSTGAATVTPSPLANRRLPKDAAGKNANEQDKQNEKENKGTDRYFEESTSRAPIPHPSFPQPKLRLEVRDLVHPGTVIFFGAVPDPTTLLADAVVTVLQTIYTPFEGNMHTPDVRSVTLVLRPMDGVAYTTGLELDDSHKEIHFNLNYIAQQSATRRRAEILGVILHEMVHVWQWTGGGTAPGGLIEGIADLVRLRAGLSPPHWSRKPPGDDAAWDAGYQHTAYFLDWLEAQYGPEKVLQMNEKLGIDTYDEKRFWLDLFDGKGVDELWARYTEDISSK